MKRFLKWVGYIVGGVVALILLAVGVVYAMTSARLGKSYPLDVKAVEVPTDSMSVERGRHLVFAVGKCPQCHGDNLAGKMISDDPAFARLWSANLTRGKGGLGSTLTDADYVRAIRYGVKPDGKPLIFMPSESYSHFSDGDLATIIAYVKSVTPVDQVNPPPRIGPVMRILATLIPGFPFLEAEKIDRATVPPVSVPIGVTKEYGNYLVTTGGCKSCHNPNLSGGSKVEGVVTANLTPAGIGKWTEADFFRALRTGVRPDGRILSAVMPWPYTKNLTDDELHAMWMYIHSIPARPAGG